tara:strand:- start:570 stop:2237 length:1668 start_codon:yes stop_codon:yes gene_type:complete
MLLSGLAEMISFTAIIPFLTVLTEPERLFELKQFGFIYQLLNIENETELLIPVALLFISTVTLAAIIKLTTIWINGRYAAAVGSEISIKSFSNNLMQPYFVHIEKNSSEIITTSTTYLNATVLILHQTLWLLSNTIISILILIGLLTINFNIALTLFAVFGTAYLLLMFKVKNRLKGNSKFIALSNQKQIKYLQEGFGSIRDIILDKSYKNFIDIYKKIDVNMRIRNADSIFLAIYPRNILEVVGLIFLVSIALVMYFTNQSNINNILPLLGAFALGAQRLLPAMQQSYNSWATINAYSSEISCVIDSLNQKVLIDLEEGRKLNNKKKSNIFQNKIHFKSIGFKYKNDSPLIIENINLEIKKGEKIGIIGPTGGGKSTFIDILMGLLKPTYGEILVDGVNIHSRKNIERWMKKIAHVPQNIYLTDNSFAENIAFGIRKDMIDFDKVKQCANMARISSYIESCSRGYETIVGEGGINLSGGQKQRIGIARSLYKESELIIFDEATSALDRKTEQEVMDSIRNLDKSKTIFLVAHRLSTLRFCDRILTIEKGSLKQT